MSKLVSNSRQRCLANGVKRLSLGHPKKFHPTPYRTLPFLTPRSMAIKAKAYERNLWEHTESLCAVNYFNLRLRPRQEEV
jgi:hypothetical protein